jgi:hydroxybutyrate-dimer hydrolase
MDFLIGPVRETAHRQGDDLLSAGLGLAGLRGAPVAFADPARPTPAELRRRAIQMSWKGIADLGPLGGYGSVYGAVPDVPGREYQALARIPGAHAPHRVLVQVPDAFDATARCLVVTASSGSRGVYGAIALAGAWGLPHGCAVAYTDKGTGSDYFDTADATGVTLDGTRAKAATAPLAFLPEHYTPDDGIAIKHAHSGDNPEADWGRDVLQAAAFGLAMLDRAFPAQAPFTPANTRIIATGLSNGGGAMLQAAGLDDAHVLDAVVALEPSVNTPGHGRALYDYATEAAWLMPCALAAVRFNATPLARLADGTLPPATLARCATLRAADTIRGDTLDAQAGQALTMLHASGWTDDAIATAASSVAFDLWRAVAVTYASSYLRVGVGAMPCGYSFALAVPAKEDAAAVRAAWSADAAGIPPGPGVSIRDSLASGADPTAPGLRCLRELWAGDNAEARRLRASVAATAVRLPRRDLPIWVIHGAADGLLPPAFSSQPYVDWLRAEGRHPLFWRVPHAQHFDAFLPLPGFGDRHVPLLPYGYRALDQVFDHLLHGTPLTQPPQPHTLSRGAGSLRRKNLGWPGGG